MHKELFDQAWGSQDVIEAQVARAREARRRGSREPEGARPPGRRAAAARRKAALRFAAGTASLAAGGWVLRALRDTPAALGAGPAAIRPVADGSPNYRDGVFHNLEPSSALRLDAEENRMVLFEMFASRSGACPQAPSRWPSRAPRGEPAAGGTWLGHATALLEIDGYRVLTDPVWSERCSPSRTVGPQRLHPPPSRWRRCPPWTPW